MTYIDPKHTALVLIDLLRDFFDTEIWPNSLIPKSRQILVKNTNELVSCCRDKQIPVIWFKQEFKPDLSDAFLHMRRSGKKYTISGTDGCKILPELDVRPEDYVLFKTRFSAFFRTKLDGILEKHDINHLILAGITTAWCVRSTAVDAYQRDYNVIIAKECVAGFTEKDHLDSVQAMDGYITTLLSNSEISNLFLKNMKN